MQIPKWKKWLSHITEVHIESAPSKVNPDLYVSMRKGRYQLSTTNAIYSYGDLYDNFVKAFEEVDLEKLPGNRVLILGFGLGSIPIILEKKFKKSFHYTAVEIDESVVYLANKYAMPDLDSAINLMQMDAFMYTMQTEEMFDMICMDVFLDDVIPDHFNKDDFLQGLQKLLNPSGLLLYNRLALSNKDLRETKIFYEHHFQTNYPNGSYLDVDGNWILLNDKTYL